MLWDLNIPGRILSENPHCPPVTGTTQMPQAFQKASPKRALHWGDTKLLEGKDQSQVSDRGSV